MLKKEKGKPKVGIAIHYNKQETTTIFVQCKIQ
jgi:hypothetical protein